MRASSSSLTFPTMRAAGSPLAIALTFIVLLSVSLVVGIPDVARAETRADPTPYSIVSHHSTPTGPNIVDARTNAEPAPTSPQVTFVPKSPASGPQDVNQHLQDTKSWGSFRRWLNRHFHATIHLNGLTVRAIVGTAVGVVGSVTCSQLYLTPVACAVVGGALGGILSLIATSKCGHSGIYIPIPDYWHAWCG